MPPSDSPMPYALLFLLQLSGLYLPGRSVQCLDHGRGQPVHDGFAAHGQSFVEVVLGVGHHDGVPQGYPHFATKSHGHRCQQAGAKLFQQFVSRPQLLVGKRLVAATAGRGVVCIVATTAKTVGRRRRESPHGHLWNVFPNIHQDLGPSQPVELLGPFLKSLGGILFRVLLVVVVVVWWYWSLWRLERQDDSVGWSAAIGLGVVVIRFGNIDHFVR